MECNQWCRRTESVRDEKWIQGSLRREDGRVDMMIMPCCLFHPPLCGLKTKRRHDDGSFFACTLDCRVRLDHCYYFFSFTVFYPFKRQNILVLNIFSE